MNRYWPPPHFCPKNVLSFAIAPVLKRKSMIQMFVAAVPVLIHCAPVDVMDVNSLAMWTPTVCIRKKRIGRPSRSAAGTSYVNEVWSQAMSAIFSKESHFALSSPPSVAPWARNSS